MLYPEIIQKHILEDNNSVCVVIHKHDSVNQKHSDSLIYTN